MTTSKWNTVAAATAALFAAGAALAHGDVAPQPINTDALPDVGEEWLIENPYRAMGDDVMAKAIEIGSSGYNQNCARCHGLEVVSGGLAPDLRFLEAEEYGDEWYMERFIYGYTQNGTTKMPAFGDLLGQKAAWAIRSYIETRPDDESLAEHAGRLTEILVWLEDATRQLEADGDAMDKLAPQIAQAKGELADIASQIVTLSGAPVADSPASRAAAAVNGEASGVKHAAEILNVGLSKAQ
jgi:cytochrome c-550 PedF